MQLNVYYSQIYYHFAITGFYLIKRQFVLTANLLSIGARGGNRTRVTCLGSRNSTIELRTRLTITI